MKKYALIILAGLLILSFSGLQGYLSPPMGDPWQKALREKLGAPEYESVRKGKPLDEQTAIVKIGDRTFDIPKIYIQTNLRGELEQDGLNLLYVLPDFTSRADFKNKQEYEQARNDRRFTHMLIEKSAIRPSFDVMISNLRRTLAKEESVGTFDGLEAFKWYRRRGDKIVYYYDIYLEKDETGKIISFIECAPKERGSYVKFPACGHKFKNNSLLYDINYNKNNYLQDWQNQRKLAIEFIDSFEMKD